jgi:hypothetical protein
MKTINHKCDNIIYLSNYSSVRKNDPLIRTMQNAYEDPDNILFISLGNIVVSSIDEILDEKKSKIDELLSDAKKQKIKPVKYFSENYKKHIDQIQKELELISNETNKRFNSVKQFLNEKTKLIHINGEKDVLVSYLIKEYFNSDFENTEDSIVKSGVTIIKDLPSNIKIEGGDIRYSTYAERNFFSYDKYQIKYNITAIAIPYTFDRNNSLRLLQNANEFEKSQINILLIPHLSNEIMMKSEVYQKAIEIMPKKSVIIYGGELINQKTFYGCELINVPSNKPILINLEQNIK